MRSRLHSAPSVSERKRGREKREIKGTDIYTRTQRSRDVHHTVPVYENKKEFKLCSSTVPVCESRERGCEARSPSAKDVSEGAGRRVRSSQSVAIVSEGRTDARHPSVPGRAVRPSFPAVRAVHARARPPRRRIRRRNTLP